MPGPSITDHTGSRAGAGDWADAATLVAAQHRLAALDVPAWQPPSEPLRVAGCFVAFARGEQGPGRAGDRAWTGAAVVAEPGSGSRPTVLASAVVRGRAGGAYEPGLLALREGSLLLDALTALDGPIDVALVDATGCDHPRRAGLALHLGAVLGLPTVGVTHRTLVATGPPPVDESAGSTSPVTIDGDEVGRWVHTRPGVRPVVAHAAWRTDVDTAVAVVLRSTTTARTPEPLRLARMLAREARSAGWPHP